ncbi:MAG: DUF4357 domain-containing protein [Acidimicrobiales bacterium]
MTLTSVTLVRTVPRSYQVTYWADGIARWDGLTGERLGAWQARVNPAWTATAGRLLDGFGEGVQNQGRAEVTVSLDLDGHQSALSAQVGGEPEPLWVLATLIDGMASLTDWTPLDVTGEVDLAAWVSAIPMTMSVGSCSARGLATIGGLVVLAGSAAATSTAPTLEDNYVEQRTRLAADGGFELGTDRFVVTRHLLFQSPSAAASVMAGSNTNGRRAWRDSHGRTWADHALDS